MTRRAAITQMESAGRVYNFVADDIQVGSGKIAYALVIYFSAKRARQQFARSIKREMKRAGNPNAGKMDIPRDGNGGFGWGYRLI